MKWFTSLQYKKPHHFPYEFTVKENTFFLYICDRGKSSIAEQWIIFI